MERRRNGLLENMESSRVGHFLFTHGFGKNTRFSEPLVVWKESGENREGFCVQLTDLQTLALGRLLLSAIPKKSQCAFPCCPVKGAVLAFFSSFNFFVSLPGGAAFLNCYLVQACLTTVP